MENLKIRVATEAESKEAQELFFKLGYKWISGGKNIQHLEQSCSSGFGYLVAWSTGCSTDVIQCGCGAEDAKEITLTELRDMVNPVKEYLFKHNYQYTLVELSKEDAGSNPEQYIEIPEGCNIITCENRNGNLVYFHWKSLDSDEFFLKDEKIWTNNFNETLSDFIEKNEGDVKIIWSRHTQPEELPFIDDEPKIETATGYQLDVVGSNTYGSRSRYDGESDISYRQYLMNFIVGNRTESLNDQYAEIEKVRHNHYFKDVSDVNRIDVYEVLKRFNVTDPCLQHIIKKALCAGQRGHKDFKNDLQDILDTAKRAVEINK